MKKSIAGILLLANIPFLLIAQETGASYGPEVLVPLNVNPQLLTNKTPTAGMMQKISGTSVYFLLDTLSLPFTDDFSENLIKSYDTLDYPPQFVVDSISYDFTIEGMPLDTFVCSYDTTFSFVYDTLDSLISKTELTKYQVIYFNRPNPFEPSDTAYCWEPYYIYDTINLPSTPDTIDAINAITLSNNIDTLKVYPPDTLPGGNSKSLWVDDYAFINSNYPVDPITVGVATFDGVNAKGAPYNNFFDPQGYGVADYLTSKPIDLAYSSTDSVFFSFYFQPQGNGNDPQPEDSLVLEFFDPAKFTWSHIWSVPGTPLQNFKQVMIQITYTGFLQKGFQFRFKNYATLSGNLDHWNIDYVRLAPNRNPEDTFIVDVGLIISTGSILKDYEAIPWKHYLADTSISLLDSMEVKINNLDTIENNVGYKYNIKHNDSIYTFPPGTNDNNIAGQSDTIRRLSIDYTFPSDTGNNAIFEINNYISPPSKDTLQTNDTVKYFQRFYNYYAYDDGSAEAGYGLIGEGSKLAYKFNMIKPDTLRAVDMYFNQIINDVSQEFFYLTVWTSLSPEVIVYQKKFVNPVYDDSLNKFHTYLMDATVLLNGAFYVGWVQLADKILNIGFDKNRNAKSNLFYNVSGTWLQSIIDGTLMIRPLVGDTVILPVGARQVYNSTTNNAFTFNIYPNPASGMVNIEIINENSSGQGLKNISFLDIYGRELKSFTSDNLFFNIEDFSEGIYFVRVIDKSSGQAVTKKIFIAR